MTAPTQRERDVVDELRQAVAQAEQEPEEVQRCIAQLIQEELEEREWDAIANSETEEGGWEL